MKKWKLIIGVALVFILGVLAGSLGTQCYQRQWSERFWKDPAARRAVFLQRLTRKLQLTEGQQRDFKVIIEEVDRKLLSLRQESRAEVKTVIDESFTRMKEKLNPDQQKKLEEFKARHEERLKERRAKRPLP
jgi:predicted DNA-binding antitoxin AbrB/MazE fold protein